MGEIMALQPSPPGPDFSSADVARVAIGPEEAGRILLQYIQQGAQADPTALLAAMVKSQVRANCRYIAYPFSLPSSPGIQQIIGENPIRAALVLNITQPVDVATARERGFLLEPSSETFTLLTAEDAAVYLLRCLVTDTIVSTVLPAQLSPGIKVFQMMPPPINAISVVNSGVDSIDGVIFEGFPV
jgi:hypothetical protein